MRQRRDMPRSANITAAITSTLTDNCAAEETEEADWIRFQFQQLAVFSDRATLAWLITFFGFFAVPQPSPFSIMRLPASLSWLLVGIWLRCMKPRFAAEGPKASRTYYIIHNAVYLIFGMLHASWHCSLIEHDARRAKAFLSAYFACMSLATCHVCYLPARLYVGLISTSAAAVWIVFHWVVNELTMTSAWWGVAWPAIFFYGFYLVESKEWSHFQTMEHERVARSISEALERALRAMLASTFDASCECDDRGIILAASPQLEQLMNSPVGQLQGRDLNSLAANPQESQRIDTLLRQTVTQSSHEASVCLAAKIETALEPLVQRSEGRASEVPVSLCCVALPLKCKIGTGKSLLIGCQRVAPTDSIASECVPSEPFLEPGPEHAANNVTDSKLQANQSAGSSLGPQRARDILEDFDFETVSKCSLTYSITEPEMECRSKSSLSFTDFDLETKSKSSVTFSLNDHDCERRSKSGLRDSLSLSPVRRSADADALPLHHEVACQTEPERPTAAARPPRPDANLLAQRPRSGQTAAAGSARSPLPPALLRCHVNFKRKSRWLQHLEPTPEITVQCLLLEWALHINPSGKGCCYLHMALATIRHSLDSILLKGNCSDDDAPVNAWQCIHCKALNIEDEADCCVLCGEVLQDDGEPDFQSRGGSSSSRNPCQEEGEPARR